MPTSIPNVIKTARIKRGLSMRSFATKAGVNCSTVSLLEKSPKTVYPSTAYKICKALEIAFDEAFIVSEVDTDSDEQEARNEQQSS